MAFTRKWLSAMGIEADKLDEIINEHVSVVTALKEERDSAKESAEKLAPVQAELEKAKAELEKLKADANELPVVQKQLDDLKAANKKQLDDLKAEYEKYKAEQESKAAMAQKTNAYSALLKECGVSDKRIEAVLRVTDLSKVKLGKDGKIEDAEALANNIKSEWADFIVTEQKKGADTNNPPSNTGGKMSREDILKITDRAARQKAIAENLEVFGY